MTESLFSVIARVRRAMPRNADVMLICDEAERMSVKAICDKAEKRSQTEREVVRQDTGTIKMPMSEVAFDKKAYQRKYMRKRRAEKK